MNVRRVLSYPAPENSAGIETVYEVWGFTRESQAWLYVVLTAELPPGMATGPNVDERATVAGYFLKLQGYHEAGAAPKDSIGSSEALGSLLNTGTAASNSASGTIGALGSAGASGADCGASWLGRAGGVGVVAGFGREDGAPCPGFG